MLRSLTELSPCLINIGITEKGESYNKKSGKKLRQFIRKSRDIEYLSISVYDKERKQSRSFYIHRLVAYLYCENYALNKIVIHKDGDKMNNHFSNLLWIKCNHQRGVPRIEESIKIVEEITHLENGMTVMPTDEWHRIKKYIKVLTDQIRYNNT